MGKNTSDVPVDADAMIQIERETRIGRIEYQRKSHRVVCSMLNCYPVCSTCDKYSLDNLEAVLFVGFL